MFCPNCGSELPEDARFCGACGAGLSTEGNPPAPVEPEYDPDAEATLLAPELGFDRVEEKPEAPVEPPKKPVEPPKKPVEPPKKPVEPPKPYVQPAPEAAAVAVAEPGEKPKKEKGPGFFSRVNKVALIGVIAVVVVAILAAVLVKCVFFRAPKNAFIYFSNGKYQLMTSTEEDSAIKLANAKSDYVPYGSDAVQFTDDGKYVYFITKYEGSTYSGTGTLNRAQYGKLKQNSDKNDKYIETVDSNVRDFTPLGDGTAVYRTGDFGLYYFDGKDTQRIAKEIKSYGISDDDKRLIYSVQDSRTDRYDLYAVELKNPEEREKIVEDAVGTYNTKKDLNHILYTLANEDEDRYDLYVTDFAGESKLLAENVSYLTTSGEKYYYTVQTGSEPLYDYVVDDCAAADAGVTQPNLNDYSTPNYYYSALWSWSDPDDYDTIYTSCTQYIGLFYDSMEDQLDYYESWGYNKATYLESFINKYKAKEDSNGYLEVTSEVKRDLMLLARNLGYDSTYWKKFCFYKYQSGYTYDYDAYYEAYDRYSEAADRISLRESLKDPDNDLAVYSICCYDSGTVTTLAENVVGHELFTGGVAYRSLSEDMEKVDIMDLSDVYSLYSAFSPETLWDGACIALDSATAFTLSDRVKEDLEEMDDVSTAILDGKLYAQSGDGIFVGTVDDGAVEELVEISDEGSLLGVVDGKAYYGISEDDTYFDLYVYDSKDSTRLARDIRIATIYEDGAMVVVDDDEQVAYLSAKGEKTVLYDSNGAGPSFRRLNSKSALYINPDGELYHFDGKESTRLARNVDRLWVKDYMDITMLNYYSNPF